MSIARKSDIVAREVIAGWNIKKLGDKIISFKNLDELYYELGQKVASTNDRFVPKGSEGYIIGFKDPSGDEEFVTVVFLGSTDTCDVAPKDIMMV